jgi:hypothetical protein
MSESTMPDMNVRVSGGQRGMAETPRKESSVRGGIQRAYEEAEQLYMAVDHLADKLSDVLVPTPSRAETGDKASGGDSSLGNSLSVLCAKLYELNGRVRSLTEAVDL